MSRKNKGSISTSWKIAVLAVIFMFIPSSCTLPREQAGDLKTLHDAASRAFDEAYTKDPSAKFARMTVGIEKDYNYTFYSDSFCCYDYKDASKSVSLRVSKTPTDNKTVFLTNAFDKNKMVMSLGVSVNDILKRGNEFVMKYEGPNGDLYRDYPRSGKSPRINLVSDAERQTLYGRDVIWRVAYDVATAKSASSTTIATLNVWIDPRTGSIIATNIE